jgi:hypothetical protein
MRKGNQSGIAIGPILFVVALLAVLASAVAAGSGSFNSDTSAIKAKAQASAILEYAHEVKFAVEKLIGKGCKDTEISFENDVVSGYTNPNSLSDKSCHVFDVNGGGIIWKEPPKGSTQLVDLSNGGYVFVANRVPALGGVERSLVIALSIKPQIASVIASMLGQTTIHEEDGLWNGGYILEKFVGTFGVVTEHEISDGYGYGLGVEGVFCDGIVDPCLGTEPHYYYLVLIAK